MKKYLKTPEEVIDALHEGKTVVADSGEKIRLYKGIIIGRLKTRYVINSSISELDDAYIEEPEPLQIEVGKFYETRREKKARCFYVNEREAYFTIDGEWQFFATYLAGNYLSNKEPSEYDIIGPWED